MSALDGNHKLACDSTSDVWTPMKKSETEQKLSEHDESDNIDMSNLENWVKNLGKIKMQWLIKYLKN